MDPQSLSFQPQTQSQSDLWQLSSNIRNVQEIQQEHSERLSRLERRHDEETKVKSVWGPTSPFPSVLSGTPQHGKCQRRSRWQSLFDMKLSPGPSRHQSTVDFSGFDDDQTSNNMVRSLQLDAEDEPEPRRLGATSRANSVRFDESAKWSHASRNSLDLSRTSTGLPGLGHPMFDRSSSHKSDGRHSSAGQSAISGRANSLGLDSVSGLSTAPMQPPGLAPGLYFLGSVPSIIRCWLSENWKHDTLLYAAVCTGSYKSLIDRRLVEDLNLSDNINQDISGDYRVKLPVYFPEAVAQNPLSRSNSPPPVPQIPIDFIVHDAGEEQIKSKAIRIFIGSDVLRAHKADILLSTNSMTIYEDDQTKLSIPLVRPENDAVFKSLYITSGTPAPVMGASQISERSRSSLKSPSSTDPRNGDVADQRDEQEQTPKAVEISSSPRPGIIGSRPGPTITDDSSPEPRRNMKGLDHDRKPSLGRLSTEQKPDEKDSTGESSSAVTSSSRTSGSPAIWNNWRREGSISQPSQSEWPNVSRTSSRTTLSGRTNRDGGIKVLKPSRQASRSSNMPSSASPTVTGQSRFFDDGKRRNGEDGKSQRSTTISEPTAPDSQKRASTIEASSKPGTKENTLSTSKPRGANPIGGASAFGWLTSSSQEK